MPASPALFMVLLIQLRQSYRRWLFFVAGIKTPAQIRCWLLYVRQLPSV